MASSYEAGSGHGQSLGSAAIKSWLAPVLPQPCSTLACWCSSLPRCDTCRSVTLPPSSQISAALLVALGAVPGAWLRFRLVNRLEPMLPRKHWGTLTVNLIACLALGLIVALAQGCGEAARRQLLLLSTGFLGSFSTFSSFMAELHAVLQQRHWREALLLAGGSLLGGVLAVRLGLVIGGAR